MDLRIFGILLMILFWTTSAWGAPADTLIVKPDAPECQDKGDIIFCDYKSGNQKHLYLENLNNSAVAKVFIYSALNLHVSDDACVDVIIHNAKEATVIKSNNIKCKRKVSLSATKSEFKKIETSLGTVTLDDCRVAKLVLDSELFELKIKKSEIGILDVSGQAEREAAAFIEDAKIDTLKRLVIKKGSKWDIQRSQISKLEPQGLDIVDGILTITDSSVQNTADDKSIFENFHGSITLKAFDNQGSTTDIQTDVYFGLFYTCLSLLIFSWISCIYYLKKIKVNRDRRKSELQSVDWSKNIQLSFEGNKTDIKVKDTNETENLLRTTDDKIEPTLFKQQKAQKTEVNNQWPSNADIEKMNKHLQLLKEFLIKLKTKFEENNKTFQNQRDDFTSYKKGQRRFQPSKLQEQLISSLAAVNGQFSKLVGLSEEEEEILKLSGATLMLGNKTTRSYFHEFFGEMENIFKKKTNSKSNIKEAENIVCHREEKLDEELESLLSPVTKSDLSMIAKKYEKARKNVRKEIKFYCIPEDLLDSILDIVSDMETACLRQSSMLILEALMQAEKVCLLTLNINIVLTNVLLSEKENH